jgi:hypothetical protein
MHTPNSVGFGGAGHHNTTTVNGGEDHAETLGEFHPLVFIIAESDIEGHVGRAATLELCSVCRLRQ